MLGPDLLEGTPLWQWLLDSGATGERDELVRIPTAAALAARSVLAVGLGDATAAGPEAVRHAAGTAARALHAEERVATTLAGLDLGAAVEGLVLGGRPQLHRSTSASRPGISHLEVVVGRRDEWGDEVVEHALDVAMAVWVARDLVSTPPNELSPAVFADRAGAMARAAGLEVEVLDQERLESEGYGGIVNVGKGSARGPRLLRLVHRGAPGPVVSLVGKGITFDSGGISIKPAAGMWNMTSDMAGAAAVVATTLLAAQRNIAATVIATVPLAENLPSGEAQRPGDVIEQYGGRTVHVLNTDAEGRLVLADAIARACEDRPDYLLDVATLTGAQMVALGPRIPGVLGSPDFRDQVAAWSQEVGEGGWPMPMPEHLVDDLRSPLADQANVTDHRWAGMLVGATYLRPFVDERVAWAHLDIAGPGYNREAAYGYTPAGATGVPVRTLFTTLERLSAGAPQR